MVRGAALMRFVKAVFSINLVPLTLGTILLVVVLFFSGVPIPRLSALRPPEVNGKLIGRSPPVTTDSDGVSA
jgi:hypothetical protein